MVNVPIPTHAKGAVDSSSLLTINMTNPNSVLSAGNVQNLNRGKMQQAASSHASQASHLSQANAVTANIQAIANKPLPPFLQPVQKGQKIQLSRESLSSVNACLGWNISNPQCDLDVSTFLLSKNGKVIGDDWFVFYGQDMSPDKSVRFQQVSDKNDREMVQIDFHKLNPSVDRIVFVLTINEAFEKNLNFSMVKDAYIRIMDTLTNRELVSYQMTDYYANVISMMIGELYKHNGIWKFNAIGNGVARDLSGLCELYGVQVI